jgi:hypothetical protein
MPADFLANDFEAIARAMRQNAAASSKVLLRFWNFRTLLDSEHDSIEAAVAEAHQHWIKRTTTPDHIATIDGTVLIGREALSEAIKRYREGMPI